MATIDLLKLPEYLQQQRWFGGKGQPIKQISVLDSLTLNDVDTGSGEEFVLAVVDVIYELGTPQRYLMLVRVEHEGQVSDATVDDAFARRLLRIIIGRESIPSSGGLIRGESTPHAQTSLDPAIDNRPVRRLNVEQSNTSLVFGDQAILKIIRKLEHGPNPELEIGQFLATRASFRAVPRLLGSIQLEGPIIATLAILHQFIRADEDGWAYALKRMRESNTPSPSLLAEFNKLGRIIGELHLALASEPENPTFAPEPIHQVDLQRWSSSIIGELGVTLAAASKAVPALAERRDALVAKIQRLAHLAPTGQKIRIHGDLHLGQVLRGEGSWFVFDFEGEPSRNFNQRREKHSPLRDVAGMLRSFAYAGAVIDLEGGGAEAPVQPSRQAFLDGYLSLVGRTDLLPANRSDFEVTLQVLEIEKMLYEVRYELQNRPEWVRIPARTLMQMES